ncbi:hypothetical protein TIFTF001_006796 [Ficus carica]|uniref:Uncharacterized protein n=1 Tax=Ficus carica TaxID=3494 RepID=A0AA88D177_FICCA|nr:hypothetical protein TIFTF001_006796 [Ficus carica]
MQFVGTTESRRNWKVVVLKDRAKSEAIHGELVGHSESEANSHSKAKTDCHEPTLTTNHGAQVGRPDVARVTTSYENVGRPDVATSYGNVGRPDVAYVAKTNYENVGRPDVADVKTYYQNVGRPDIANVKTYYEKVGSWQARQGRCQNLRTMVMLAGQMLSMPKFTIRMSEDQMLPKSKTYYENVGTPDAADAETNYENVGRPDVAVA